MKTILKIMMIGAGICLLASCAEDRAFDNGYYSSSYSPNLNPGNTGYNRNYQQGHNGYYSRNTSPNGTRGNTQMRNGYSTTVTTAEGGYSSDGYSSSNSG